MASREGALRGSGDAVCFAYFFRFGGATINCHNFLAHVQHSLLIQLQTELKILLFLMFHYNLLFYFSKLGFSCSGCICTISPRL